MTTPSQATQPRGSIDKSKVDLVEAEEAKESRGNTSLSMAVNQQRGFVLQPTADTARKVQAWYIGHRSNNLNKILWYSKTLQATTFLITTIVMGLILVEKQHAW